MASSSLGECTVFSCVLRIGLCLGDFYIQVVFGDGLIANTRTTVVNYAIYRHCQLFIPDMILS
jgi:hypothetical protein